MRERRDDFFEQKKSIVIEEKNTYDDRDSLRTRLGSCFRISDSLTASVKVLKTVLCVLKKEKELFNFNFAANLLFA